MKEIFRTYTTAHGATVTVIKYTEADGEHWHVKHSNPYIESGYFSNNRRDAMIHAQFLVGKY